MNSVRSIGMDVHRDTISVAVLDEAGRMTMQSVLATRAAVILEFLRGQRATLHVTLEEGTHAEWLHDAAGAAGGEVGGVRSAEECAVEVGE